MGPITAIIPTPRTIPIGGGAFLVGELRLQDLAELQAALDATAPDPLDAVLDALPTLGNDDARRVALTAAYEALDAGPPTPWDERGAAWLLTTTGLATLLFVALRRHQPITPAECVALAETVTPGQFARLRRIAFGVKSRRVLERMLGLESNRSGPRLTWPEVIAEVAERFGYTLPEIRDLTLTELAALRSGGKADEGGRVVHEGEDLADLAREQYRRFHGHDMPEGQGGDDAPVRLEP